MLARYSFRTESGHTVEAIRTTTGYDFHTRNAKGETISTVARDTLQSEILIAQLKASEPAPAPTKRTRRKASVQR